MIISCKTENKKTEFIEKQISVANTISETEEIDYWQHSEFKVTRSNNENGKQITIDSLHFDILKRYFKTDSTKLLFVQYDDFVNDTIIYKKYYKNGNLKEIKKYTYRKFIPIGNWTYYNSDGTIKKTIDHSLKYKVSFQKAMGLVKENGIKKPYETQIYKDSLYWEIMNWKNVEFDTISNEGIDQGKGILINRENGNIEKVERKRKWVT